MRWPQAINRSEMRWEPARPSAAAPTRFVVAYTDPVVTRKALEAAAAMADGLDAVITLVAVQVVPFPAQLECPQSVQQFLEERLGALACDCTRRVEPAVVVARTLEDGYRQFLPAGSAVLLCSRRRVWPTREERLARMLRRMGHSVALMPLQEEN